MPKPSQGNQSAQRCRATSLHAPAPTPGQCPTCGQTFKGAAAKRYILQCPDAQAHYGAVLQDPKLISQREEIALLTAYMGEQLKQLSDGSSSQTWQELRRVAQAVRGEQDGELARAKLLQMMELIERGSLDDLIWQEIRRTMLERDRLVRSERQRIVDAREFITAEEGIEMMEKLAQVVRQHVTDEEVLKAIAQEFAEVCELDGVNPAA